MITKPLLHGVSLAIALILPLGAQNTFIINQGATHKKLALIMPAVITAGLCDTLLIILATTGVSSVVLLNETIKYLMLVVSVLFLGYLGYKLWITEVNQTINNSTAKYSLKFQIMTAMTLSLLNPHAIADTIAAIGTSALAYEDLDQRFYFTLACIVVSWIWFFALSLFGKSLAKNKFYNTYQNKISSVMIWLSCIFVAFSILSL